MVPFEFYSLLATCIFYVETFKKHIIYLIGYNDSFRAFIVDYIISSYFMDH